MHVNVNKILKSQTPVKQDFDCQNTLLNRLFGLLYPESNKTIDYIISHESLPIKTNQKQP